MLLFFCAGIFLVGVLNTLGIVSMVGGNRYECIGLAGLYYGLFGGGGGLVIWAIYRRFRPWQ